MKIPDSIKRELSLTNMLLMLTCAVALVVMYPRAKAQLFPRQVIRTGQRITIPNYTGKKTLVLSVRNGCQFCEEDIPIYQKVSAARRVRDGRIDIVTIVPPNPAPGYGDDMHKWLSDNNIPGTLRITKFPVPMTPIVVLLGEDGVACKKLGWDL